MRGGGSRGGGGGGREMLVQDGSETELKLSSVGGMAQMLSCML